MSDQLIIAFLLALAAGACLGWALRAEAQPRPEDDQSVHALVCTAPWVQVSVNPVSGASWSCPAQQVSVRVARHDQLSSSLLAITRSQALALTWGMVAVLGVGFGVRMMRKLIWSRS